MTTDRIGAALERFVREARRLLEIQATINTEALRDAHRQPLREARRRATRARTALRRLDSAERR